MSKTEFITGDYSTVVCSECGKEFVVPTLREWTYKVVDPRNKYRKLYQCSYTCNTYATLRFSKPKDFEDVEDFLYRYERCTKSMKAKDHMILHEIDAKKMINAIR